MSILRLRKQLEYGCNWLVPKLLVQMQNRTNQLQNTFGGYLARHHTVGAAGELFAIRTELYQEVEKDTLLDDFIISLRVAQKGYTIQYDPEAYAIETASANVKEELKRKVRISAGGIQSVVRLASLLNIFKYGTLSFQYI